MVVVMLALPVSASATGVTLRKVAGLGEGGGWLKDGQPATNSILEGLGQITRGPDGSIYYVVDGTESQAVIKETPDGILHVFTTLWNAEGIAVGSDGSVFVAVPEEHVVWKYSPDATTRVRYAGTGNAGEPIPGAAASSPLQSPDSLAVDSSGDLYIADFGANRVEKVTPGGTLSIAAGKGSGGPINPPSGPATSTPLVPRGVAVDSEGNLYITTAYAEVAKVTTGGTLTRLVNVPWKQLPGAPQGVTGPDYLPNLTVDGAGNVYTADYTSATILELNASGVQSTFAGNGEHYGAPAGDLPPTQYGIYDPEGVAAGPEGEIYYTARGSGTVGVIRSFYPHVTSITPLDGTLTQGGNLRFHVTFSEPAFGVDAGDFSVATTGTATGSVTAESSDEGAISSNFTVTVHSGGGDGTLRLNLKSSGTEITDAHTQPEGNADVFGHVTSHGFTGGPGYTIDNTPPEVTSIIRWYGEVTGNSTMLFLARFNTEISDVVPGDFAVTASAGVTGATVTQVQGTTHAVTVTVEAHGKGTVRLDLKPGDGTIKDEAGNGYRGPGYTGGESYRLDQTPPTVTSWALDDPQVTAGNQVSFTVTFDQVVEGVPTNVGVLASGTVTGAGAAPVAIGSTDPLFPASETWRITLTGLAGDGTLAVQMLAGENGGWGPIFSKQLGIPLVANVASPFYIIDHTAPRPVSVTRVGDASTTAASVQYKLTFSEQIGGLDAGDLTPVPSAGVGATVSAVTLMPDDPFSYLVTLSGITGTGTVGLELDGSGTSITDRAGIPLAGGLTATELFSVSPPPVEEGGGGGGSGEGEGSDGSGGSGGSSGSGGGSSDGGNPPGGSPLATPTSSLAAISTPGACTEHPALKSNGRAKGTLSVQATWPSAPTAPCSLTATLTGKPAKKGKKAPVLGTGSVVLGKAGVETFTVKLNAAGKRLVKRGKTVPVTLTLLDGETVVVTQALKLSPVA
jgi:uncharacterized membrane protein YgcG